MAKDAQEEYQKVLDFWFVELNPEQQFVKDPALDQMICERFLDLYTQAVKGELHHWRKTPEGALAEIILLDQLSRNMFRDTAKMFAFDPVALTISQHIVDSGAIDNLPSAYQNFVLMPYMHSESKMIHDEAIVLREKYKLDNTWEVQHRNIIDRFGRYPHRNQLLGRESTAEEREFLKQPGSSF